MAKRGRGDDGAAAEPAAAEPTSGAAEPAAAEPSSVAAATKKGGGGGTVKGGIRDGAEGKDKMKVERRSAEELDYLEQSFIENPLPSEMRRQQIGQILGLPERKVMIWFQNKRQRMKQKMKVAENANLKEENAKLQRTLAEERTREEYLRRENRELKVMLGTRQQRMEELRSRASRLLIEYYANKSEAGDPQAAAAIPKIAQALGMDDFAGALPS